MPHSDPEQRKAYQRAYYLANREKALAHAAEWRRSNPARHADARRRYKLRTQYGLAVEEYDALFEAQGGVCAICEASPTGKVLHVDHDHGTGAVRGLLCDTCNRCLGLLRDDVEVLKAAIAYLEAPRRHKMSMQSP